MKFIIEYTLFLNFRYIAERSDIYFLSVYIYGHFTTNYQHPCEKIGKHYCIMISIFVVFIFSMAPSSMKVTTMK